MTEREQFEEWYSTHALDYESNPIGCRDCALQWDSWQASGESLRARIEELVMQVIKDHIAGAGNMISSIKQQEPVDHCGVCGELDYGPVLCCYNAGKLPSITASAAAAIRRYRKFAKEEKPPRSLYSHPTSTPEGWHLVPDDLTPEMLTAWWNAETAGRSPDEHRDIWRQVLAAAPKPGDKP